jgi:glyoxylase-like metal-dependent hydrolase (beta-lactamase superfamily II)
MSMRPQSFACTRVAAPAAECQCCVDLFGISRRGLLAGAGAGLLAAATTSVAHAAPGGQIAQAPAQAPVREITQIGGNLFRFRNNFHYSVFAVTTAGIIATDPINADAARWLQAELQRRHGQPVRYLVYSHDHADHISGGEVFAEAGAIVVAHENAKAAILGEKRPTAVPQLTFRDHLTIELGGTIVELAHVGRNHSDNSLIIQFPAQRALFTVDWIPVDAMPFRDFPDAYLADWLSGLRTVEALDFDLLIPGHGPVGRKEHVRAFRVYMEELRDQVLAGVRAGRSVAELKETVRMERYAGWAGYADMRPLNVEGMYRLVQGTRRPNA